MDPKEPPEECQKQESTMHHHQDTDSQEQFAAALSAKLDNLTETRHGEDSGGSCSPEVGDYENPDSMETQGDALCVGSGPPSPMGSVSELDLTNSPNSLPIPDCDPESAFTSR